MVCARYSTFRLVTKATLRGFKLSSRPRSAGTLGHLPRLARVSRWFGQPHQRFQEPHHTICRKPILGVERAVTVLGEPVLRQSYCITPPVFLRVWHAICVLAAIPCGGPRSNAARIGPELSELYQNARVGGRDVSQHKGAYSALY